MELARYGQEYGLTNEARRLLNTSPFSGDRSTSGGPDRLN